MNRYVATACIDKVLALVLCGFSGIANSELNPSRPKLDPALAVLAPLPSASNLGRRKKASNCFPPSSSPPCCFFPGRGSPRGRPLESCPLPWPGPNLRQLPRRSAPPPRAAVAAWATRGQQEPALAEATLHFPPRAATARDHVGDLPRDPPAPPRPAGVVAAAAARLGRRRGYPLAELSSGGRAWVVGHHCRRRRIPSPPPTSGDFSPPHRGAPIAAEAGAETRVRARLMRACVAPPPPPPPLAAGRREHWPSLAYRTRPLPARSPPKPPPAELGAELPFTSYG
ncbi:proline-rich receptor-like protein kinase PERK9 [Ananas comosus]|uniref:Proline-rich receptor-like protein kinase PERK9 n=1 Tax=Ananas comosus TaxID=4615 RepID=A0A6P5FME5_ANACO|nr:proline-rich receptor-like protein kinase PERK9 [Ananas comosus]